MFAGRCFTPAVLINTFDLFDFVFSVSFGSISSYQQQYLCGSKSVGQLVARWSDVPVNCEAHNAAC